jgi:hypothetical protein
MLGDVGLSALFEDRGREALGFFRVALMIDRELDYAEGLIYAIVGIAAAVAAALEPLEVEVEAKLTETLGGSARY